MTLLNFFDVDKKHSLIVAGLTGGIATGKSTVSAILSEAGAIILDADQSAHDVTKKGLPAWHKIVRRFGRKILLPDGEIDRDYLGDIIFKDPDKKQVLNSIVHPLVFQDMSLKFQQVERNITDAVIILDIPLLIESKMHKDMSDVILVYTPEHVQIKRLMRRDNLSEGDALARINSQMPIEGKKAEATLLIDNSSKREKTRARTLKIYDFLKHKID